MNVRQATSKDIPQIVNLLKLSLGESLMPKSEKYWQWKHIDNPFGTSPVFIAEKDNLIVGVRAFMKWQWQRQNESITAIRAVDTATHPAYQGQGIFKKLTLALLDECRQNGVDLVYNTPNAQSKPGYLKMGWVEAGSLPVKVTVKKVINVIRAKLRSQSETKFLKISEHNFSLLKTIEDFEFPNDESSYWQTSYSIEYLKWRYLQIPVIPYYGHSNHKGLIIFRLKQSGMGVELRVCDTFGEQNAIYDLLHDIYYRCSFDYMTINGFSPVKLPGMIRAKLANGPDVTIRGLGREDLSTFKNFASWHPSFGDLEVF